jgi:signal transduction histidine kinase
MQDRRAHRLACYRHWGTGAPQLIVPFKEALQNVVKHAHASEVILTLAHQSSQFRVGLADNGRAQFTHGGGPDGLRNIPSCIGRVGEICTIQGQPAGGTAVEMCISLTR